MKRSAWLLPALMLAGASLGLLLGGALGARWSEPGLEPFVLLVRLVGAVFLSFLKALVVPLVVTSIVASVAKLEGLRGLGRLVVGTGLFFLATSLAAVLTGMAVVNGIEPGSGVASNPTSAGAPPASPRASRSPAHVVYELVTGMFPPNLFAAASEGNVLGLIVFGLLFGAAIAFAPERSRALVGLLDVVNDALLRLVRGVVWLAPLGILGLVADRVGNAGGGAAIWVELRGVAWYAVAVLAGLAIHAGITLPLLLLLLTRHSPPRYLAGAADALLTAFGTASSAAAMGVTLRCARRSGVSEQAADFVIPLGTTVNMNGTALYEAVAAIFIAQSLGIELTGAEQLLVVATATLAAIGAAAIPEAGLVTLLLVLSAVGLPAEGIGLILSIDWILDRFRTAVNVWGDLVGAAVVDRHTSGAARGRLPS